MTVPTSTEASRNGKTPPLIELRHVRKVFTGGGMFNRREVVALSDFSLSIDADHPTIMAVVGESGSGKTTMARILLGLETPSSGEVLYHGTNIQHFEQSKTEGQDFRRNVQAVFQDPFGVYNAFYKIDHVLETPLRKFKLASGREEMRRTMEQALRQVGLQPEYTLGRYPHQLSGGQRQRTMIARTLLIRPRIIVADEPVSMIDASLRANILGNLLQLKRQFGISLVYITHDLTTAYQISDRIIVLYRGDVVESGEPEQIIRSPQHPYTQLLIRSIPEPDPDRRWGEDDDDLEEEEEEAGGLSPGAGTAPVVRVE